MRGRWGKNWERPITTTFWEQQENTRLTVSKWRSLPSIWPSFTRDLKSMAITWEERSKGENATRTRWNNFCQNTTATAGVTFLEEQLYPFFVFCSKTAWKYLMCSNQRLQKSNLLQSASQPSAKPQRCPSQPQSLQETHRHQEGSCWPRGKLTEKSEEVIYQGSMAPPRQILRSFICQAQASWLTWLCHQTEPANSNLSSRERQDHQGTVEPSEQMREIRGIDKPQILKEFNIRALFKRTLSMNRAQWDQVSHMLQKKKLSTRWAKQFCSR